MAKKLKKPIKHVVITLEGKNDGDIEFALDEVRRKIQEGYTSGSDQNESGAFYFESSEPNEKELNW